MSDARKYISAEIIHDELSSMDIPYSNNKFQIEATCLSSISTEEETKPDYSDVSYKPLSYIYKLLHARIEYACQDCASFSADYMHTSGTRRVANEKISKEKI